MFGTFNEFGYRVEDQKYYNVMCVMEKRNKRHLDVQMSGVKVGGHPCETGGEEDEGKKRGKLDGGESSD